MASVLHQLLVLILILEHHCQSSRKREWGLSVERNVREPIIPLALYFCHRIMLVQVWVSRSLLMGAMSSLNNLWNVRFRRKGVTTNRVSANCRLMFLLIQLLLMWGVSPTAAVLFWIVLTILFHLSCPDALTKKGAIGHRDLRDEGVVSVTLCHLAEICLLLLLRSEGRGCRLYTMILGMQSTTQDCMKDQEI